MSGHTCTVCNKPHHIAGPGAKFTDEAIEALISKKEPHKCPTCRKPHYAETAAEYTAENQKAFLDNHQIERGMNMRHEKLKVFMDDSASVYAEPKQHNREWKTLFSRLLASADRYGREFGVFPNQKLREYNGPIIDEVLEGLIDKYGASRFTDSIETVQSMMDSSVNVLTILNQPTIGVAVIIQAFQDVESLQFMHLQTYGGSELRVPHERFNSAENIDLDTYLEDLFVQDGEGIPESEIKLDFKGYQMRWRKNGISLTDDIVNETITGPVKYDAIARAIWHLSQDKARKLDSAAYYEMFLSSDEYQPLSINDETPAPGDLVSVNDSNINVVYRYSADLNNNPVGISQRGTNPIVRPRTKIWRDPSGVVHFPVFNQCTVKVAGNTLVRGYLDKDGNVQGPGAVYAVDWENGIFHFTTGAQLNPEAASPILPIISYYAVTNYDRFSITVPTGIKRQEYYNEFLYSLSTNAALMGNQPRYRRPNLAIFSLNSAVLVENAQLFYKPATINDTGGRLISESAYFGERSGMNLAKINTPTIAGDGRVLLTRKGATRYGIGSPYELSGPHPKYDTNGSVIAASIWYGKENSVICTPQVTDDANNVINPVSRTIKLVP